ncbi:MAG TPA: YHYH protein [Myxococcota bacterium]|nr:YHYH protein [Myxococcota bacterium]
MRWLTLIALAGCADELYAPDDTAADVLGPPVSLTVSGAPTRGGTVSVTANLPIGGLMGWLAEGAGMGAGPCPAALLGTCLDVTAPVAVAATTTGDGAGHMTWSVTIDANAPDDLAWQGVVQYRGRFYKTSAVAVQVSDADLGEGPSGMITPVACTVPEANISPANTVSWTQDATNRRVTGNGMPDHAVGPFPNPGNPNTIATQNVDYRMPLNPSGAGAQLNARFGVGLNGVIFDPYTAEYYQNNRNSGWRYQALGTLNLGPDCNHAHVQPGGLYHYHGLPEGLIDNYGTAPEMTLIGYAADGYPMYARYGLNDPNDSSSGLKKMVASFRLKTGTRPSGPGGAYDGTFEQDYEYVAGLGDLDECNGRTGWTPDHGTTYHYYVTETYPFISRCYHATPHASFAGGGPPPPIP